MNAGGAVLIVAIALLAGLLIWAGWAANKRRREAFAALAKKLGLRYEPDDPYDTTELPFALFSLGSRRSAENMLSGETGGIRVRLFDYWYQVVQHNANGPDTTSTYRFSCAIGELDAQCPHLVLQHETFMTRLADHLGFRDIEFESEEFNKAFQVKSDDARFASALVDPRMMQWLLDEGGAAAYEVCGALALCYTHRVKPPEYESLLGVLRRFREHVPNVVSSLYPRDREAKT